MHNSQLQCPYHMFTNKNKLPIFLHHEWPLFEPSLVCLALLDTDILNAFFKEIVVQTLVKMERKTSFRTVVIDVKISP